MPYYPLARDWLPDMAPLDNPGVIDAVNVLPHPQGFMPMKELQVVDQVSGTATMSLMMGAFCAVSTQTGRKHVYAASSDKFWVAAPAASPWKNKTGAASVGGINAVFARFGDLIICAQGNEAPQKSTLTGSANVFSALAGTPPTATLVAVVRDFVVFARTQTDRTQVVWSAVGN